MKRTRQNSIVFAGLIAVFGIVLLTVLIPKYIKVTARMTGISPRLFPQIIAGLMIVLSAAWIIMELRAMKKSGEDFKGYFPNLKALLPQVALIGSGIIFLVLAPMLGFVIASVPFVFFLLWLFGSKRWWLNAIVAVAYPIVLYVLFHYLLRVNFPVGMFGI